MSTLGGIRQLARPRPRSLVSAVLVGLAVLGAMLLAIANAHLVYVAFESQPDCVPHIRSGAEESGPGQLSAAMPSC